MKNQILESPKQSQNSDSRSEKTEPLQEVDLRSQVVIPPRPPSSLQRQKLAAAGDESSLPAENLVKEIHSNLWGIDRKVKDLANVQEQCFQALSDRDASQWQLIQEVRNLQEKMAGELQVVKEQLAKQVQTTEILTAQSNSLESASREMAKLNDRCWDERIIQPMAKNLFPMFDLLADALMNTEEHPGTEGQRSSEYIRALQTVLVEFLALYNVEPFQHQRHSRFDPKLMAPIQTLRAPVNAQRGIIQKSERPGFRLNGRILRHEQVVVYE